MAGCDAEAREFARRTALLLKQRSTELSRKINAEMTAYAELTAAFANSQRTVAATALRNERNRRAIEVAADYAEGRRPVSRWQTDLLGYAQADYDAHRELFSAGIDADSRFMAGIQALEEEQAKVDAAAKLLDTLQKPPSLTDELGAATHFAEDVKKAIDERCAELKKRPASDLVAAETFKNLHCPAK
jgi:hypothetical protein